MRLLTVILLPLISANYQLEVRVKFVKFQKLFQQNCPDARCGCSVSVTFTYVQDQLGTIGPYDQHGTCYPFLHPFQDGIWPSAKYTLPEGLLQRLCVNYTPVFTGISRTFVIEPTQYQTAALHDVNVQPNEPIDSCQHLVFGSGFHEMIVPELNISDPSISLREDFLTVEYMLTCDEFYYGDDCGKRCKDFEFGYYTCDELGNRQCQNGFQGFNCTCKHVNGTLHCGDYEPTTVGTIEGFAQDANMDQLILVLSVCLALVVSVCGCIGVCIYLVKKRNRHPPPALAKSHPAIIVSDLSDGSEETEKENENAGVYVGEEKPTRADLHKPQKEEQDEESTEHQETSSPSTTQISSPSSSQFSSKPTISAPIIQTPLSDVEANTGSTEPYNHDPKPRTSLTLADEMEKAASDLDPITEGEEDDPQTHRDVYQSQPCLTTNGKLTLQPWLSQPQLPNGLKQSLSQELAKRRFKVQTFVI